MPKKITAYEISDETLSRRFWRKSLSINDKSAECEVHKECFTHYQKNLKLAENETTAFPACVQNVKLQKALITLTAKQQKVIELYYFQNMTQEDIAEKLSCSQVAVSKLLLRAMEKIKNILGCAK